MSASYEYISPFDPKTDQKNYRDSDGKVITQPPNVQASLQSKISYGKNKQFKYTECPPSKQPTKIVKDDSQ